MLSVEFGIVERKGAWFMYKDQKFQGIQSLIDALREDEDLFEEIRQSVMDVSIRKND